jgi:hypothetical protein
MRLSPIPPDQLNQPQRALHEKMQHGITQYLQGFVSARPDGALIGPFNPMLHFPQFGGPGWALTGALAENSILPKPAHETAILTVAAAFNTRYEIYAHEHVAGKAGLASAKIATITAGQRPGDLSVDEGAAYDVASVLARGRQLPESTYQAAVQAFGETGVAELIYLVGAYCLVSVILNAYDISVPGREEGIS